VEERSQCGLERSDSSRVFDYTNWKYIEATGRCSAVAKSRGRARWNSPTLARVPRTWRVCPGNKREKVDSVDSWLIDCRSYSCWA